MSLCLSLFPTTLSPIIILPDLSWILPAVFVGHPPFDGIPVSPPRTRFTVCVDSAHRNYSGSPSIVYQIKYKGNIIIFSSIVHMEDSDHDPVVPDLPISIISDILSRLSVEDVARYRCVCKSWCILGKEPHFTYLHLTRSADNILLWVPEDEVLFGFTGEGRAGLYYMISNGEEEDGLWKTTNVSPTNQRFRGNVVASCNGLLCINTPPFYSQGPDVVYNPFTKDHIFLPESSFHPKEGRRYDCGFGFDSTTKKYKVLKCYHDNDDSVGSVNILAGIILTLGESSWRSLQIPDEVKGYIYDRKPLFFNGAFHWVFGKRPYMDGTGLYKCEIHVDGILTLEISSEKFGITKFLQSLVLPENFASPVQLDNSVASFLYKISCPPEDHSFDIWQILGANTDGSCLYKHKTFTVSSPSSGYLRAFKLLGALGNGLFLFEASLWTDPWCNKLVLFDPDKGEGSVIEIADTPKYFDAFIFTPSLISPAS